MIYILARLHCEVQLNSRLELILQEYDYIVKDEMCVEEIVKQIESYASKSPEENWDMKINRFDLAEFGFTL